jgi:tRNA-dihydrouridine synthase
MNAAFNPSQKFPDISGDECSFEISAQERATDFSPWVSTHKKSFKKPDINEITKIMSRHLNLCLDFHGQRTGLVLFRKFFNWYTKAMPKVRTLRKEACYAKNEQEMLKIIENLRIL